MTEHETLRESAGLYVLGALPPDERRLFEAHLASCAECAAEVRTLGAVSRALPYAVSQVDPPPSLRDRVLSVAGSRHHSVAPAGEGEHPSRVVAKRSSFLDAGWLSAAALLLIVVGLGIYAASLRGRVSGLELDLREAVTRLERSEQQVATATSLAQSAQIRMAVLMSPDLKQVELAGQTPAPKAAGRAFWSAANGLVFAATSLPPLPDGRVYQLWLLPPGGAPPASAGLVRPDASGRVAANFDSPADTVPAGFALSIEPADGVPSPTGDVYLAGMTQ